ncbi:MAG: hypothetical protein FIA94_01880 [Nitrospirae bacterium]|nr:hypothetical protein [Nitrospirota bacterium]
MKKAYWGGVAVFFFICLAEAAALAASPTLIQPNGGESIRAGDVYTIQWSASVDSVKYNLYLSCDNGTTWSKINSGMLSSVSSYDWDVITPAGNMTNCLVKVIGYNGSGAKVGADVSDAIFTVSVLNVTSPSGGDTIDAGSIVDITWSTDTLVPVSSAILSYTTDGLMWLPVKGPAATGNPGTYRWTVPQIPSSLCKVKVALLKSDDTVAAVDKSNGKFSIKVTPKSNASFSGEYFRSGVNVTSDVDTQLHDFIANGNGTVNFSTIVSSSGNPSGTVTYTMSPNGRFDARNTNDGDSRHGILSPGNDIFLISNTTQFNGIGFGFGIKASAGLDNSALSGTYAMGSISKYFGGSGWTDLSEVTFDGAGNGTVHCLYISNGSCFADFSLTYTVSSNGRVTTSMPGGWSENGAVSSDGRIFSLLATSTPDNMRSFRVGMRKTPGGLSEATFAGKFIGLSFGATKSGIYVNVMSLKSNGAGTLTLADLYNSFGGLTQGTATYSVGADGTLNVPDGSPAGFNGVVLDNGQAWLVVDTDTTDGQNEMSVTVGLKTSK